MAEPLALDNNFWSATINAQSILTDSFQNPKHMSFEGDSAYGLLTRTVIRSPVVKWILPARIRHKDKNDVVFVGSRALEIKEVSEGRNLLSIAIKADFDSEIKAARIFGETRKSSSAYSHDTLEKRSDDQIITTDVDSPSSCKIPPQMLVLSLKTGTSESVVFMFAHQDGSNDLKFAYSIRPLPSDAQRVFKLGSLIAVDPKSRAIAVAASAGRIMIYRLKSRERMRNELETPGGLLIENFQPILQERLLEVNAVILKMEFLHPPRDLAHQNSILLAAVMRPFGMSNHGKTYLKIMEWDSKQSLNVASFDWQAFPLPNNEKSPSLLIPLTISTGVLLACQARMYMYRNLLSGYTNPIEMQYDMHSIDQDVSSRFEDPGDSRGVPLCTGWARAVRHTAYAEDVDSLYICREDGAVVFYELKTDGNATEHFAGKLDVNVDTAFACLDLGTCDEKDTFRTSCIDRGSYDVLVIGGNMSDGGLFKFKTREKKLPRFQRLRNWAPVLDFAAISTPSKATSKAVSGSTAIRSPMNRNRIFACADRGTRHGAICEMRFGTEAQSCFDFQHEFIENLSMRNMTRMWIFPEVLIDEHETRSGQDHAVVCVSNPEGTERFTVSWTGKVLANDRKSYTEMLLDNSEETLTMAITRDRLLIQITVSSIRAVIVPFQGIIESSYLEQRQPESRILHASIDRRLSRCLIASKNLHGLFIQVWRLVVIDGLIQFTPSNQQSVSTAFEISCLYLTSYDAHEIAVVGTTDGKVILYSSDEGRLTNSAEVFLSGDTAICETICMIAKPDSYATNQTPIVLCGVRNGTVHVLGLRSGDKGIYNMELYEKLDIELEPVLVYPEIASQPEDDTLPTKALILSRDCFCRLFYKSVDADRITMQCVWITHPDHHDLKQSTIKLLSQYSPWNRANSSFDKSIFIIDSGSARLVHLDESRDSMAVPRQIRVHGTPTRIVYASKFEKLIVAFEHVVVPELTDSNAVLSKHADRRRVFPVVQVLDLDASSARIKQEDEYLEEEKEIIQEGEHSEEGEGKLEAEKGGGGHTLELPPNCKVIGNSGEKVMGMSEWLPTIGSKTWCLLIVNTLRVKKNGDHEDGRIHIYHLRNDGNAMQLTLKETLTQDFPVYAMAPFGSDSLVFCSGTSLIVQRLSLREETLRFSPIATAYLKSAARHISVNGHEIYVSTSTHSVTMFSLDGQNLVERFNDIESRRGFHNVVLKAKSLVMASDLSGTIRGLQIPRYNVLGASFRPVFEASLPGSISRLRVASFNPREALFKNDGNTEIIGSTFDGSFYSLQIINSDEYRLLRYIADLLTKDKAICPILHRISIGERPNLQRREQSMHIDGDILVRVFQWGNSCAVSFVEKVVSTHLISDRTSESAEDRRKAFEHLVKKAVSVTEEQCHYKTVVRFMRSVLQVDT